MKISTPIAIILAVLLGGIIGYGIDYVELPKKFSVDDLNSREAPLDCSIYEDLLAERTLEVDFGVMQATCYSRRAKSCVGMYADAEPGDFHPVTFELIEDPERQELEYRVTLLPEQEDVYTIGSLYMNREEAMEERIDFMDCIDLVRY